MLKIEKDEENIFQVSNNFLTFEFNKKGENKGKFKIVYKLLNSSFLKIEGCYSSINFYRESPKDLKSCTSKDFEFISNANIIDEIFGEGLIILFTPSELNKNENFSFTIQVKIYEEQDFILLKLIDIKQLSSENYLVHSIAPLTVENSHIWLLGKKKPSNLSNITWFKHGWQSWSPCKLLYGNEKDSQGPELEIFKIVYDNQDYGIKGRFYSEYCTAITDSSSKNTLILGFISFKQQFTRIILDYSKTPDLTLLTAFGCMDGIKLPNSEIDSSEELYISYETKNTGYLGLIKYAEIIKDYLAIERISEVPMGWCSWYYYYTEISQSEMIKNLEFFQENRENIPIDFIQLDDGYFTEIGDYKSINDKFPNGLEWLYKQINSAGFKGGIWTAPFFAVRKSKLFKNHREWFLKKSGKLLKTSFNWNAFEYSLDLSNLEVLEYLTNFYSALPYAYAGFNKDNENLLIEFLKIDFLYSAIPYGVDFKNNSLTRAQIYYKGIKTIRDAITENVFLLGCGAPLGPCIGLVDAMRIGYDTGPLWEDVEKDQERKGVSLPCLKVALINIVYRSFMHNNLWINDPDCLMIRRTNTDLNLDEIRLQITLIGLSGGQVLISDDMAELSEEELSDAKLVIPPYNSEEHTAFPVDCFTSKLPSIYLLETHESVGHRYLVAFINWSEEKNDKKQRISEIIPFNDEEINQFLVFDFWNEVYLGQYNINDKIKLKNILPHSCRYLSLVPIDEEDEEEPIFLSSNLHITQGCWEITDFDYNKDEDKISMIIDLEGEREGWLFLKLPKDKEIGEYSSDYVKIDKKNNIWKVYVEFINSSLIEIGLS
ncbi:MAG: hypothetical protein GF353_20640 [Candidatus Lokiarchaeota archaeon]|nr:hypothetical protein [Candidatus Lokiarchaeota archaeon]